MAEARDRGPFGFERGEARAVGSASSRRQRPLDIEHLEHAHIRFGRINPSQQLQALRCYRAFSDAGERVDLNPTIRAVALAS